MLLYVKREPTINGATPGKMFIDGQFYCFTLEPEVRLQGIKIYGKTAIPAGEYFVHLQNSPHFGRLLPKLMNVPNFSGILIHRGNTLEDTMGCVLVGFNRDNDKIYNSKDAEEDLMERLKIASKSQILAICIEDADDPTSA